MLQAAIFDMEAVIHLNFIKILSDNEAHNLICLDIHFLIDIH
jgi:hypothetical protein